MGNTEIEKQALEIAARLWCEPSTQKITMNVRLAEAFAAKLVQIAEDNEIDLSKY